MFADLRGGLAKKRGGCFWGGVEIPMHTMSWRSLLIDTNIQTNNIVTVILLIILTIIDTSQKNEVEIPKNSN